MEKVWQKPSQDAGPGPRSQNTICLLAPRARSCQALSLCGHRRWPGGWSGEKGGPIHHCQPGARAAPRRRGTGRVCQFYRVIGLLFEKWKRRLADPNLCLDGIRTFAFMGFCSWAGRAEVIKRRCLRRANVGSDLITFASVAPASLYQRDKEPGTVQWEAGTLWTSSNPLLAKEN